MITFFKLLGKVIDSEGRRKFTWFGVGAILIAAMESIGVFFALLLTEVITQDAGDPVTGGSRRVGNWFGAETQNQVALVLSILVLVTFVLKAGFAIWLLRGSIRNSLLQEARLSRRLFATYMRAPYTYHIKQNSADLQRTLNESMLLIFRRTMPWLLAAGADVFAVMGIAAVLILSDPVIAAIALVYFAVIGLLYMRLVGGRQRAAAIHSHLEAAKRYQQVQEPIRAVKEVAVLHREDGFIQRFNQTKLDLVDSQTTLAFYLVAPRHFLDVAFLLGAGIVAAYAFATRSDAAALATVGVFFAAGFRLVTPIHRIVGTGTMARTAGPALRQVVADLEELKDADQRTDVDQARLPAPATVAFDGVRYAYDGAEDVDVLDGISLSIEPGDDVGFVGTTGSGKTTIIDLLLGLLDPTSGTISVDGTPLAERRTAWQKTIGYVPQEIILTDDTIRANVAFGVPEADIDDQLIWESLRLAQVDDFIATLPDGLLTVTGEDGVRLSGGQRQRIGLARALYGRPDMLVLDEATSALDSATERRVIETIEEFHGSLTIVSVAHRLSTLKHCDRIYFLVDGSIRAVGTFDELRSAVPEFESLVSLSQLEVDPPALEARDDTARAGSDALSRSADVI